MPLPSDMTFIDVPKPGDAAVLTPARQAVPTAGSGEVLIRVAAAGVNAPDLHQRRGRYDPPPGASPIIGLEVSGEIAALGEGARRYKVGDRVVALCNGGGYAEFVAVPEGQVLPLPRGWSLVDGAALPETFFTIQQTLVMRAGLAKAMRVLIHGGAGGIGGAAIGIAVAYGARPMAIVSSPEKADYAKSLGAVATIDRTRENFVERTMALTDGHGADRIVDVVGASALAQNLAAAATEAVILQLGSVGESEAQINVGVINQKRLAIIGSRLRPQPREVKAAIAASLAENVWPALADGTIKPPRIQYFPLAEAVAAHRAMEEPSHFGKIVLVTPFGNTTR